jgi:hypothetical protein
VAQKWSRTEVTPFGDSQQPRVSFPSAAAPQGMQVPAPILVRSNDTGNTRLAVADLYQSPVDATVARASPGIVRDLEPSFKPGQQNSFTALVKAATLLDALVYAPRGFGWKLLVALAGFSVSALAAVGVLITVTRDAGVWVWFGASVFAAVVTFAGGVRDALMP